MGALQAGLPTLAAIPGNVYRIIMDLVFGFCFCLFVYLFLRHALMWPRLTL